MNLIQCRIRCLSHIVDSDWFVPGKGCNLVYDPDQRAGKQLLQAIESLNPLYSFKQHQLYREFPQYYSFQGMKRKVVPEKKSAVLTVFEAEPDLVRSLERIEPDLIETDRIEVGRRLDYSRWVSFVEIPATIRWREIADEMVEISQALQSVIPGEKDFKAEFISSITQETRIKGELARRCSSWLNRSLDYAEKKNSQLIRLIERCLYQVNRETRFYQARREAERWLPFTIGVDFGAKLSSYYNFSELVSNGQNSEPISLLLRMITSRYQLDDPKRNRIDTFKQATDRSCAILEKLLQEPCYIVRPCMDENGINLTAPRCETSCQESFQMISTLYLLALIAGNRVPLLLFHQPVEKSSDPAMMGSFLAKLGENCQFFVLSTVKESYEQMRRQHVIGVNSQGRVESLAE